MKYTTAFFFLLLGSNYLLPFNTVINSFGFFDSAYLPIPPLTAITILNFMYQLAAIGTYVLYTKRSFLFNGSELCIGTSTTYVVILCLLSLMTLFLLKTGGVTLLLLLILFSSLASCAQSVFDNINVYYAQLLPKNTILFYTAGINISGTIHAAILVLLRIIIIKDTQLLLLLYYSITVLLIACSIFAYQCLLKDVHPSQEEQISTTNADHTPARIYMLMLVLNFAITLFAYPALLVRSDAPFELYNEIFVFFVFNSSALLGNVLALFLPTRQHKVLFSLLGARLLLCLPIFMLFRFYGFGNLQPLALMCLVTGVTAFFAFTSAYIASCAFYVAPSTVQDTPSKVLILRYLNLSLSGGLLIGSLCSTIFEFVHDFASL